jgi:hypothetical protein
LYIQSTKLNEARLLSLEIALNRLKKTTRKQLIIETDQTSTLAVEYSNRQTKGNDAISIRREKIQTLQYSISLEFQHVDDEYLLSIFNENSFS